MFLFVWGKECISSLKVEDFRELAFSIRYVPEDKRNMHKGNGACVSPKHIRAEYYKGVYDYDSFRNGCMYRNIFHVCTGTGI